MKSGADVFFALFLIERQNQIPGEDGEVGDGVDEARPGISGDVINVVFVDRPGIDLSLQLVDGAVIKSEGF